MANFVILFTLKYNVLHDIWFLMDNFEAYTVKERGIDIWCLLDNFEAYTVNKERGGNQ